MRKLLISTILLLGFQTGGFSQENLQLLTSYLEEARTQGTQTLPQSVLVSITENERDFFILIESYLTDSSDGVKYRTYKLLHQVGQRSSSESLRQRVVATLLNGIEDEAVAVPCSGYLGQYAKDDFVPSTFNTLIRLVEKGVGPYVPMIKLAGYLDQTQVLPKLSRNLLEDKLNDTERWATYLVLARMSDPAAIDFVERQALAVSLNDEVISELFEDLAFTRQKRLVQLIVETVLSDATQCVSASNDDDGEIPCAYRAMEFLPGLISDFPWQRDVTGDLAVDDYEMALINIRTWLTTHPNFEVDRSGFE
ncbi:MAG: hypothetical protein AAFQ98_07875 [Bacteroidota bacterium]